MKKQVSIFAIIFAILILIVIFLFVFITDNKLEPNSFIRWFLRVIVALCVSTISVIIPGYIGINPPNGGKPLNNEKPLNNDEKPLNNGEKPLNTERNYKIYSLADNQPKIVSYGAIAIFIIVYLFNPFNG